MPEPDALLARLREHCPGCPACDPAVGTYCWQVRDVAEAFWEARRDEVFAGRAVASRREAHAAR